MDAATKRAAEERLREMIRTDLKPVTAKPFTLTRRKGEGNPKSPRLVTEAQPGVALGAGLGGTPGANGE